MKRKVQNNEMPIVTCPCIKGVTYLLLTEFEGRTVSYGPSFFLLDFARGP